MIKKLFSEKGASSILVVLLLVVLLVFGIAALTTALSSARLGQKVTEWNTKYYAAEALANERLAVIDKAVHEAYSSEDFESSLNYSLSSLGFEVSIERTDGLLEISYEAASGEIAIEVLLSAGIGTDDIKILRWRENQ